MPWLGVEQMKDPLVTIIIPNWNGAVLIVDCLRSLADLNYPKESMEIIVVDNASSDGSKEAIKDEFRKMQTQDWHTLMLIENPTNVGAPAAYNQAIKASSLKSKYYLKLDNDVIVHPKCLVKMVSEMESNKRIGIVGPKVYYFSDRNRLSFAGGYLNRWTCYTKHLGVGKIDNGQYDQKREVNFITGCAMLISKQCIDDIGFFNENYFWYYDEADFVCRAIKNEWLVMYIPIQGVWHKIEFREKETSKLGSYYFTRNHLYFCWSNFRYCFVSVLLCSLRYNIFNHLFKRRWDYLAMDLKAYIDFFKGKMGRQL
jgi:hypothetical protein